MLLALSPAVKFTASASVGEISKSLSFEATGIAREEPPNLMAELKDKARSKSVQHDPMNYRNLANEFRKFKDPNSKILRKSETEINLDKFPKPNHPGKPGINKFKTMNRNQSIGDFVSLSALSSKRNSFDSQLDIDKNFPGRSSKISKMPRFLEINDGEENFDNFPPTNLINIEELEIEYEQEILYETWKLAGAGEDDQPDSPTNYMENIGRYLEGGFEPRMSLSRQTAEQLELQSAMGTMMATSQRFKEIESALAYLESTNTIMKIKQDACLIYYQESMRDFKIDHPFSSSVFHEWGPKIMDKCLNMSVSKLLLNHGIVSNGLDTLAVTKFLEFDLLHKSNVIQVFEPHRELLDTFNNLKMMEESFEQVRVLEQSYQNSQMLHGSSSREKFANLRPTAPSIEEIWRRRVGHLKRETEIIIGKMLEYIAGF